MKRVWSQFIGTFFLVFLAGGAVTGAFFSDVEGSTMNFFSAFKLDAEVVGDGFDDDLCAVDTSVARSFMLQNVGGLDFSYDAMSANFGGDAAFCNALEIRAERNGALEYDGPLSSFAAGSFLLAFGESDGWEFELSVASGTPNGDVDGKTCTFDTLFFANQQDFLTGQAFFDIEPLSHSVMGIAGGSGGGGGNVVVVINNNATVTNTVNVSSNTGGNSANGGNGGAGGDGGDGGNGGDGGDGGNGGNGGTIITGSSSSSVVITNVVNTNETTVTGCCATCGCSTCSTCGSHDEQRDTKKKRKSVKGASTTESSSLAENVVLIRTVSSEEAEAMKQAALASIPVPEKEEEVVIEEEVEESEGGESNSGTDGVTGEDGEDAPLAEAS